MASSKTAGMCHPISATMGASQQRAGWIRGRRSHPSSGSAAAPMVSGPAIWLTPLLLRREVAESILAATAPTLLVGSLDDPTWDGGIESDNSALEVLELDGLDHSLEVSGDPLASLDVLRDVISHVDRFFPRLV